MKKKPVAKRTAAAKATPDGLAPLIVEVRNLIQSARRGVASVIDTLQVLTNFEIGRRIVEHEQKGEKRAEYGSRLVTELSARLAEEFGKGFSRSNLQNMRSFFLLWQDRVPKIRQQPIGKFAPPEISQQPQDALAPSGQDFAGPCLRGSGIVAPCPQQHLPRLSTMRTKGGSFFSGPRLLRGRCA
jgi:hypothetical protein